MNELTSALTGEPCFDSPKECVPNRNEEQTVVGQLARKKAYLEIELAKLNDALDAFKADPKLADALTKISKAMQVRY